MKKRFLALLLALVMALTLLPTAALAAGMDICNPDMLIFGDYYDVEESYHADVDAQGDGWIWVGATRTLTLHNAQLKHGCSLPVGATLILEGENFITLNNNDQFALTGYAYSITGPGSLTTKAVGSWQEGGNISGNVVFRGSGEIIVENGYIGNDALNKAEWGSRIRIESGIITALSITESPYKSSSNPHEIVITGGTINAGSFHAIDTDVIITGGNITIDSKNIPKRHTSKLASFRVAGYYSDGQIYGGHFTFLGGTLSITESGRMALMSEFRFKQADRTVVGNVSPLITLGSTVSVSGGALCPNLVFDGYVSNVASDSSYAAFAFSENGESFSYWDTRPTWNCAKTLTLSGPNQIPDSDLLWEPTPTTPIQPTTPTPSTGLPTVEDIAPTGTAVPTPQTVKLNGKDVQFQTYAIKNAKGNDTNYVKIRDLASALNGTKAQFNVDWDGKISIVPNAAYTSNGTEGSTPYSGSQTYKAVSETPVSFNGSDVKLTSFSITYQGGGYTYYKLLDLAQLLNFDAHWDGSIKSIVIETDKPHTGN